MNNIFSVYQQFMQNPIQMVSKKYSLPEGISKPDDIINHLVKSGQVSQGQIDSIKNNPMFNMLTGIK